MKYYCEGKQIEYPTLIAKIGLLITHREEELTDERIEKKAQETSELFAKLREEGHLTIVCATTGKIYNFSAEYIFLHRFEHEEAYTELKSETQLRMYIGHDLTPPGVWRRMTDNEKGTRINLMLDKVDELKKYGSLVIGESEYKIAS